MVQFQGLFVAIGVLAAMGWFLSYYFFQVHHKRLKENIWWIPPFLRMTDCRCNEIVESPFGRMAGRSNAYWGLWYYGILVTLLVINDYEAYLLTEFIFIITLLAFFQTMYLLWGLFTLKVACRPCLGIHGINTIIFFAFLKMEWHNLFMY